MNRTITTLALVAAAFQLGGCASLTSSLGFSGGARSHASATPIFGAADLEQGKAELRAGRIGNAIAALHLAALNRDTAGEAFNALGIAYARLGRADLAERYLKAAILVDPQSERFVTNLSRFYISDLGKSQRALAQRRQRAEQQLAVAKAETRRAGLPQYAADFERRGAVVLERPRSRIVRQQRGAIAVFSAPTANSGRAMEVSSRRITVAAVDAEKMRGRALVTKFFDDRTSTSRSSSTAYPLRITLRTPGVSGSRVLTQAVSRSLHPVRIAARPTISD